MPKRKIATEIIVRLGLGTVAAVFVTAVYAGQLPANLLGFIFHAPDALLLPIIVVDVAILTLALVAKPSQLPGIVRCYAYAALGYAVAIYFVRNGHDVAVPSMFYAPLLGWAIAVVHNHFGRIIWSFLTRLFLHGDVKASAGTQEPA